MPDVWEEVKQTLRTKHIPLEVVIELTRKCNLDCCHCYNVKDRSWLSFDQVKIIAGQLRAAGTLFITLTGGEVFTHPDIIGVCAFLRDANFSLNIFTNATLIDSASADKLQALQISEIGISLHGASARIHERISGCPGSYEKTLAAIRLLKERGLFVNLKCTLMRENFAELDDIVALAKRLDVAYIIDPVVSPKDDASTQVLQHRLPEAQMREFYFSQFRRPDYDPDDEFTCGAGFSIASINSRGDVYPCVQFPKKLGNVFEREFLSIWENADFLKMLRLDGPAALIKCAECEVAAYCTRCPGMAYLEGGDAFSCSITACQNAKIFREFCLKKEAEKIDV